MKIYFDNTNNINICKKEFKNFLDVINLNSEKNYQSKSKIWKKVIDKFKIQNKIIQNQCSENILRYYEKYFHNGLSEGACAGKTLHTFRVKLKYYFREPFRINKIVKELLKNGYDKNFINNLPLSLNAYTGGVWKIKIFRYNTLLEISDHLYFYIFLMNELKKKNYNDRNLLFIGDGSGFLSNLILNSIEVKKCIFLDLPQFLIRQRIVNNDFREISKFVTPCQIKDENLNNFILINQDSFPEIAINDLKVYFSYLRNGSVKIVYSYNQKPKDEFHSDFVQLLDSYDAKCVSSYESIIRKNYYIEKYISKFNNSKKNQVF
jgi:hypothetical protein